MTNDNIIGVQEECATNNTCPAGIFVRGHALIRQIPLLTSVLWDCACMSSRGWEGEDKGESRRQDFSLRVKLLRFPAW